MSIFLKRLKAAKELGGLNLCNILIRDKIKKTHDFEKKLYPILSKASTEQYEFILERLFILYTGNQNDIKNPKTFTEKIQWIKLHESSEIKQRLADKYLVRGWVEEVIGKEYLPKLIGVWEDVEDIQFEKLPSKFVLKCNHGSGYNIIVKEKDKLDISLVKELLKGYQQENYAFKTGLELQYKSIKPLIICEDYMEEISGSLYDYKFHCFNGNPQFIQCIGNRNLINHTGNQNNYDLEWNKLDWVFEDYPEFETEITKPDHFEEMKRIAKALSENFDYVRVDLYDLPSGVIFGEMTFTPGSGFYPYKKTWTKEKDMELGKMIKLRQS